MTTNNSNELQKLYQHIEDAKAKVRAELDSQYADPERRYKASNRNSLKDEQLRGLLLMLHNDSVIARTLDEYRTTAKLYDPTPNESEGEYLTMSAKDAKVLYTWSNEQGMWNNSHARFELYDGRFYANGTELLDLFPKLTSEKLIEGAKESLERIVLDARRN